MSPTHYARFAERAFPFRWWIGASAVGGFVLVALLALQSGGHGVRLAAVLAGPLIGLWDRQEGVPGRGEVFLLPGTWFSIELSTRTPVPEWGGKELFVGEEEDAILDEVGRMSWVLKRQTEYHLIH